MSPVKIIVTSSKEGSEEVEDEVVQIESETEGSVKDTPVKIDCKLLILTCASLVF